MFRTFGPQNEIGVRGCQWQNARTEFSSAFTSGNPRAAAAALRPPNCGSRAAILWATQCENPGVPPEARWRRGGGPDEHAEGDRIFADADRRGHRIARRSDHCHETDGDGVRDITLAAVWGYHYAIGLPAGAYRRGHRIA